MRAVIKEELIKNIGWDNKFDTIVMEAIFESCLDMMKSNGHEIDDLAAAQYIEYALEKLDTFRKLRREIPACYQGDFEIILKALWLRRTTLATPEESASAHAAGEVARFFMTSRKKSDDAKGMN